jgi:1,4-alpha-glucan branching enzyme
MPVNEFEGNESWGYNPSFYFAADKYYGPAGDLKAFIDACHNRGIAVIIDLVLNHSYGQSPLVQLYFDQGSGKVTADNPWYNVDSPNPVFFWGYDFNHESQATQDFVDRVNRYWLEEFHVDGIRFDFTKGFTNTSGDGSAYDPARIAILSRMANEIWSFKEDAYVILEHLAGNQEEYRAFPSWNAACGAIKMLIMAKPPWGIMIRENRISVGSPTWKS